MDGGIPSGSVRVKPVALWLLLSLAKLWLAARLPAFGDEAFYIQEGRRLAWAYSDLPGLTAWLTRLGQEIFGQGLFAARLPFFLLGALLPWQLWRISARWFGPEVADRAALLAMLMPLGGLMGVLALPDVPLLVAGLLCVDGLAAMMAGRRGAGATALAAGLVLGALAHYRFAAFLAAGLAGLLLAPAGRRLLREPRLWLALAAGALAWWPLLRWNLDHAGAGLGFQFVDRHPWTWHAEGLVWPLIQAVLLTPLLFAALLGTLVEAWRRRREGAAWPFLFGAGAMATLGWFLLGFFADSDRVSFHWPLAGWLLACCAAPVLLWRWRRPWRRLCLGMAAAGSLALLAYLAVLADPDGRRALAGSPAYADNFSGWSEVAEATRRRLQAMPTGTRLVADNFMLGAQLSLALGRDDVLVLEHPLNAKHGRAPQLRHWGLLAEHRPGGSVLVVLEDTARPGKHRLRAYRALCEWAGSLDSPEVLNVDHGRKRFLLFALPAPERGGCVLPAMADLESPRPGQQLESAFEVAGWAIKPGAGVARVEVLLDGEPVAEAIYGHARPDVLDYWGLLRDGADTGVGLRARVEAGNRSGAAWLSLRVHGRDGSVEELPAMPVRFAR
ncbi:ArnT family glycosyltransferase [Arenimonas fontis]|uniref:Glycosyltransferase family 39 protein n=1 Tax=Arenimonas fontis TaxID=2608255 RepID=A0A5B2ZDD8_9GAMM|nr:glycosyltransferase family 39 protein [Arenimonas fontis]KAA2285633.1 glycosyltransferase family 39 protein [Arenimonas fontis]